MDEIKSVFIVDDDVAQATMMKDYLSKYSELQVHTFNSGEECLKRMDLKPQIVFLDYNFDLVGPNAMDGIDVLKEIKAKSPSTEVVMVSGQDKIQVAVNTMKYGAFDYVVKSESAFHRSEHLIFSIIRSLKLQKDAKMYRRLTYYFGVAFVLTVILVILLWKTGHVSDNPGWF